MKEIKALLVETALCNKMLVSISPPSMLLCREQTLLGIAKSNRSLRLLKVSQEEQRTKSKHTD
jgi:hypothetical protein